MTADVTFSPSSTIAALDDEHRLQGLLDKKSDYLGKYNPRHVRLGEDGSLRWYVDADAESAKGGISLAHAEVATQDVPAAESDGEGSPAPPTPLLHLKVPSRSAVIFRCPDATTRAEWASALRELAVKATAEKVQAEEEKKKRAAEAKRLKSWGGALPPAPSADVDSDAIVEPSEIPVKGTAALTSEEIARLTDTEALALETAMDEHKQRAQVTAARAEKAAEELRTVRERQSGGKRGKELRLTELDAAAAELTKHHELLVAVTAAEARARTALDSSEGAARSAAERLGAQEEKRRAELKGLEEEHAALLATHKEERAALAAELAAAKGACAKADSCVNVATTMVQLRNEQLAGLEALLTTKEHERDVLVATLEGQKGALLTASASRDAVEAELASMVAATAEVRAQVTDKQNAERAAKLLAASKAERLVAARSAAAEFAGVMAAQGTQVHDPSYAPSTYHEHADRMSGAVAAQLETAKEAELTRAKEAAAEISLLKAKVAAADTAIGIKTGFVADLVEAHEVAAQEVENSEVAADAAAELCAALAAQRSLIEEELSALEETLRRERSASAEARKTIDALRAGEKALAVRQEHAVAAIDALLVEERALAAAFAEKRTPAMLPVNSTVFISVPTAEGEAELSTGAEPSVEEMPLPAFFSATVEEVAGRLMTLAEMREVVVRDHAADAKQLAAVATQATAQEALAAAETAAQARARAALEKYEAALS